MVDIRLILREDAADTSTWLGADARIEAEGAACSLWWHQVPPLSGERPGIIGGYRGDDDAAAAAVLARACAELRARGCTRAIGPMDGNTWRKYRLLTERGSEPPFLLEPDTPDAWVGQWRRAGFVTLAGYSSSVVEDLAWHDPRLDAVLARMQAEGLAIRRLRPEAFVEDLRRIHAVSVVSFAGNFLYTPLSEAEFVAMYRPIEARVRPELVLIAERGGQPVSFAFGLPDLAQAQRGVPVDTMVLKTLAVLPGRAQAGLGKILTEQAHRAAAALGLRRAIHALMHDANSSRMLVEGARTIRRYELLSQGLG